MDVMREVKAGASAWVHATFPDLEFWWQSGYGAFSGSHSNVDVVKAYVANQRKHHKRRNFEDEFRAMLEKHGVAFKEEYLF